MNAVIILSARGALIARWELLIQGSQLNLIRLKDRWKKKLSKGTESNFRVRSSEQLSPKKSQLTLRSHKIF